MWLDYKGQRHFLPTGMPEEPYLITLCVYYCFTSGLDSSDLLLQTRRYIPSSLSITLSVVLWRKVGLTVKLLTIYLAVCLLWMVTYPATYWLAFHKNTLFINHYIDLAFASYIVSALIIAHALLYSLGSSRVKRNVSRVLCKFF